MSDRILADDAVGTFMIGGDLNVRRLGFGAMRISGARNAGGARDRETARQLVRRVVDRGVNFLDTANIYGYGEVEEITENGADAHIDALAKHYLGKDRYPFRAPGEVRVIYKIRPRKISTMG